MVKTNQDITGEQRVRNDDGLLAVSDQDQKIAWKSYHEDLFTWDRNSLTQTDTISGVPRLIGKDMVRESISKIKYGKAAQTSGLVSEMVKVSGKAESEMIIGLVSQIIVDVIPAEWKLSTIVNCDKGKRDSLQRGNYRELKLTDQILKIAERIIDKLIR